jgi:nitronate monooxygenase
MPLHPFLGTELPVIQAPMAGVQGSALAVAVCEAGALGSLPCAMLDLAAMRAEFERIRGQTSKPFNANFFCHAPALPDAPTESAWRARFAGYYAEMGLDLQNAPAAAARLPFSREMAELVCEFKPEFVSFHFGLPAADLLDRVRASGAKLLSSATSVEEALWLQARGVDAIIAQGLEAGGHQALFLSQDISTQLGTFALLPQIVAAVKVPVIAAGGIACAHGVRAALELGASAVQVGTAYLLCPEATTSTVHRQALQSPAARVTALSNVFTGRPARGIVNRLMRELGPMNPGAPAFPLAGGASLALRQKAESLGSGDFSPLWAGQNTTGCRDIPAGQLTRELAALV